MKVRTGTERIGMTESKGEKVEKVEKVEKKPGLLGFTVERVNAFSDGVFAVAITLMGVNILVPTISGKVTEAKLAHGLASVWPHFFAFVLSFIIIGMFWISHHALFSEIRRANRTVIWINLIYLLLIVFIPYNTMLMSQFGNTMVSTVMYAANMATAGIVQAIMAFYATHDQRLVDEDFNPRLAADFVRGNLIMAAVFLISIGIAFASPQWAKYFWVVLFITPLFERAIFGKTPTTAEE